jgi:hypothetical protein
MTITGTLTLNTVLAYGSGGTGATGLTQHGVVVAGASALTTVAPGSNTNVLTSNGTDWTSAAAPSTSFAAPALTLSTANSAGVATTAVRTDATILAFDTTSPVTQAYSDAAATGSAAVAARRDHKHGMPGETGAYQSFQQLGNSNYSTTSTSFVVMDATNMAKTFITKGGNVLLMSMLSLNNSSVSNLIDVTYFKDTVNLGSANGMQRTSQFAAATTEPMTLTWLDVGPTMASHTYDVRWKTNAGTASNSGTTFNTNLVVAEI